MECRSNGNKVAVPVAVHSMHNMVVSPVVEEVTDRCAAVPVVNHVMEVMH